MAKYNHPRENDTIAAREKEQNLVRTDASARGYARWRTTRPQAEAIHQEMFNARPPKAPGSHRKVKQRKGKKPKVHMPMPANYRPTLNWGAPNPAYGSSRHIQVINGVPSVVSEVDRALDAELEARLASDAS